MAGESPAMRSFREGAFFEAPRPRSNEAARLSHREHFTQFLSQVPWVPAVPGVKPSQ